MNREMDEHRWGFECSEEEDRDGEGEGEIGKVLQISTWLELCPTV